MNSIELILANSTYSVDQFSSDVITILNEMYDDGIPAEQLAIIAHPEISSLTYSILYEYLKKGNTITSQEFRKYMSISTERVNKVIVNVYLGKLHGLSEEQIDLYSSPLVFNVKIARLLVEHAKDASTEQLEKLVYGKFGTKSETGKLAIQEFLDGEINIDILLMLSNADILYESEYEYVKKNYQDKRLMSIVSSVFIFDSKRDKSFANFDNRFKQATNIDDCYDINDIDTTFYNSDEDVRVHFDSVKTYKKLEDILSVLNYSSSVRNKLYSYYKNSFTANTNFLKYTFDYDIYYIKDDIGIFKSASRKSVIDMYFNDVITGNLELMFKDPSITLEEYLDLYVSTKGFGDYCDAIHDNSSDDVLNMIKQGYSYLFSKLLVLYKTKKDKETEIPYLTEQLKDATDNQIKEVICMKENKCSNDEIHYFIENYLSKIEKCSIRPTTYYDDSDYSKYFTITQYLDYSKSDINSENLLKLKQANCTDEEFEFVLNNLGKIGIFLGPVYRELIQACMYIGVNNIDDTCYITDNSKKDKIPKYTYAKSIFKNKPKCLAYYVFHTAYNISIPEHLVTYVDNFDDDTLYKVLDYASPSTAESYVNFALQMSTMTTNVDEITKLYNKICDKSNESKVEEFNNIDEKITADVIIKFCKKNDVDVPDFIKDLIPEPIDTTIEKSVEYFDSSKNFKPIKYDDETIYVDIVGNKALKGSHIITFNKEEDDDYEYIFEIAHEDDTLTYSAKITTKKDVKDCITKSIALIENIDEYSEYVEELQNLLKTI